MCALLVHSERFALLSIIYELVSWEEFQAYCILFLILKMYIKRTRCRHKDTKNQNYKFAQLIQ